MTNFYTIWTDESEKMFTLVEGLEPLHFVSGEVDTDCHKVFAIFNAENLEEAESMLSIVTQKNHYKV